MLDGTVLLVRFPKHFSSCTEQMKYWWASINGESNTTTGSYECADGENSFKHLPRHVTPQAPGKWSFLKQSDKIPPTVPKGEEQKWHDGQQLSTWISQNLHKYLLTSALHVLPLHNNNKFTRTARYSREDPVKQREPEHAATSYFSEHSMAGSAIKHFKKEFLDFTLKSSTWWLSLLPLGTDRCKDFPYEFKDVIGWLCNSKVHLDLPLVVRFLGFGHVHDLCDLFWFRNCSNVYAYLCMFLVGPGIWCSCYPDDSCPMMCMCCTHLLQFGLELAFGLHRPWWHVDVCNFTWHVHPYPTEEHKPKHFLKEFSSATVVEGNVLLIFFDFRRQQDFHMTFHPSKNYLAILVKTLSCLSVKTHLHCFCRRHHEIPLCSMVLWVARKLKFHRLGLELSRQLDKSFHITSCWRNCLWSTSGYIVATLKRCPALQPIWTS